MAFSENLDAVSPNGYATAYIKLTSGGTSDNVGLIAEAKANAIAITRELSKGTPTVGYDLKHAYKMAQTSPADWTAFVGARTLYESKIAGSTYTSTITADASTNLFAKVGLEIDFSNKADSFIEFEVVKPGQKAGAAAVTAFLTASS